MTNVDQKLLSFRDRFLRLETEKRERAEDIKELHAEMKGAGLSPDEISGVALSVRRSFETDVKAAKRRRVEEIEASLGHLSGTPLGDFAR